MASWSTEREDARMQSYYKFKTKEKGETKMRAMKKATKRMIALFLTAIMTLAMAATSFATMTEPMPAAATTGKLTVTVNANNNSLKGQTINLYKLFDIDRFY